MESEILKFICANQGAVDVEDLMFNLFPGESTNEVISNQEKFVLYYFNGTQKVVARTSLRLCRTKVCSGSCENLHLCKNFLLSGQCQMTQGRSCHFSHDLNSDHNQKVLKQHVLERLNRVELCTLLLQNDNTLLPSICHDYNNGTGLLLGNCQKAFGCERLHICEKYLKSNCICYKTHDFYASQPLKSLYDKGVPDSLIPSLRSVYANKEALRLSGGRGNRSSAASKNSDVRSDAGPAEQKAFYRGRGRGGNRGQRGNRGSRGTRGTRGKPPPLQQTLSFRDFWDNVDGLYWYNQNPLDTGETQKQEFDSSYSDIWDAANDIDSRSDCGLSLRRGRGRGGSRGNGRQPNSVSLNDLFSNIDGTDVSNESQQDLHSSNSDVSAVGNDADTSGTSGQKKRRARNRNRASGVRGKGVNQQGAAARSTDRKGGDEQSKKQGQRTIKDKTEICMFFIKGFCKNEDRCVKAHDKMPYRWQVQEGDHWKALPANETIEKDYCDPNNSYSSGNSPVHFDTMTCGPNKVRRLSTVNSVIKPDFIHTTEWLWHWQDENGKWNRYGSDSGGCKSADVSSAKLEQRFLDNDKDVVEFTAGSQSYTLSFSDMIQTNKHYGTKRLVSRRPLFVSAADVKTKKVKKTGSVPVPDTWDTKQIPLTGFSRVALQSTSNEFQKVKTLFHSTLKGFDIVKLERIQNKALWEVFQWQKTQMKNNNGGVDVTEEQLFHGTDSKYVDAICLNNFDWRICGTHGTAFGKGSYFARDAKYSHSYTGNSSVKTMFICRVLVGSYTKGNQDYVRPPSKDGGDINFYDSCVNDVTNPSIFVVFEKHQIYPEYLLQYKTADLLDVSVASSTVSVQTLKPILKPTPAATSSYQKTTSSVKPKIPSYQQTSSLRQTSTLAYPSSTSAYSSSTSAYSSSTSAYPSSTSAYSSSTSAYSSSRSAYPSSTSAYSSSTSAYPSSTSAYSSSTSAYPSSTYKSPFQSSLSSQSSYSPPPPKTQPKKSDSCVIS